MKKDKNAVNSQNLPIKKQPLLAKCFIPGVDGWTLIQADYKSFEASIMAYEIEDEDLMRIVASGKFHDHNTETLFGLTKASPIWKDGRDASKIAAFGGLFYGGGIRTIYRKVMLKVPSLTLTEVEFERGMNNWIAKHPKYGEWKAATEKDILSTRRVVNAFGRVRILGGKPYDILKEGLNFKIQGTAASIINRAMIRIHNRLKRQARLLLQIHDSLLAESPSDEVTATISIIKEEMERPVDFRGKMVSFPIEVEIGPSWGEMTKYANS